MVAKDCTQVLILGRACLEGLGDPPADWPPVRQLQQEECFDLVAGPTLVAEAIARDAYLITPGWLDDWRGNLRKLGFDEGNAAEFFHDFARELLLLDTGVAAGAQYELTNSPTQSDCPPHLGYRYRLPAPVSLPPRGRVARGEEQQQARERERNHARELADHKSAMDFLGRLPLLKDERETIAAIEEMFHMLFAPEEFHYLSFSDDST